MKLVRAMIGLLFLALPANAEGLAFTPADILGWEAEMFQGQTVYRLDDGAIEASCRNSASGLVRRGTIDLDATPIIEWSWRVAEVFDGAIDERGKSGDDFPARLYVVKDGGLLAWRTRAINYVWANAAPRGATWPNPFASQVRMVAVQSGPQPAPGRWVTERRNLRDDFRDLHGRDLDSIDAVAIMTDCDNRNASAKAWYGTVRFLKE